jgi:hypothetical protein
MAAKLSLEGKYREKFKDFSEVSIENLQRQLQWSDQPILNVDYI